MVNIEGWAARSGEPLEPTVRATETPVHRLDHAARKQAVHTEQLNINMLLPLLHERAAVLNIIICVTIEGGARILVPLLQLDCELMGNCKKKKRLNSQQLQHWKISSTRYLAQWPTSSKSSF